MKDDYDQPEPRRALPVHGEDDDVPQAGHADWYAPEDDSRLRTLLFRYLPILFLCLIGFWPALWNGQFLWQDDVHVTANAPLRSPLGLWILWKSPTVTPTWAPLSYTLLWPQHLIWSASVPKGYHLVNLFLHTFNAIMVWMLLRRLDVKAAIFAAIVFALHPMQVEPVAWIARQPMLFATFWGLLSTLIYLRYAGVDNTVVDPSKIFRFPETPWLLYTFAILTYLFALLSYPLLVCSLPVVMLLIVWWKKDDFSPSDVYRALPLIFLGIAAVALSWFIDYRRPGAERTFTGLEMVLVPGRATWFYLTKTLLPINLMTAYRPWEVNARDVLQWLALISIVVIGAALWLRRREIGRTAFAAFGAYLLLLLPMITPLNRVEMESAYVADRFNYLAMIVPVGIIVGLIGVAMSRIPRHTQQWAGPVAASVGGILLAIIAWSHATSFTTPLTMWENTVNQDDENYAARIRLGKVYQEQKQIDKAIENFERVDRVTGGRNLEAKIALGEIAEASDIKMATLNYQQALGFAADRPEPYRKLGAALVKQKLIDDAVKIYQDGLDRFPKDAELQRLMGLALASQKKFTEAAAYFTRSIELNPFAAQTRVDFANILQLDQKPTEAMQQYNEAVKIDPRNYDAYMGAGALLMRVKNFDAAYNCFHNACYFRPDEPDAWNMCGVITIIQAQTAWVKGDPNIANAKMREATTALQRALQLKSDYEAARKNLELAKALQARIAQGPPDRATTRSTQPSTQPSTQSSTTRP